GSTRIGEALFPPGAKVDPTHHASHPPTHRIGCFARDELDRLKEARAGTQRVRQEGDRVRELLVEGREAATGAPSDPEPRHEVTEERADDAREGIAQHSKEEAKPHRETD